jgi:hypothetical protein
METIMEWNSQTMTLSLMNELIAFCAFLPRPVLLLFAYIFFLGKYSKSFFFTLGDN